ncbi:16S rRNA (uracil(1498)-N(3))-methyltransferase [Halochromatium salexigens]|uniref:Ribosomal RNA small subunit methyltransferase E n=1 Tax=Halochromatium salexigens TaxID=49447 RepID=A0AAJ0UG05_HALSE|nr:16S rRNA (uracil(1498)-N(3))-methyltransferase [Halochromatium salexigens]MBK5930762.1 16S rRNA (uracil(1498)-N(3))-methyltransferase [Halochromatium salexigens]
MRENRLYTEQPLRIGECIELEPRPAKHAAQVLRLGAGESLTLFNGDGRDYRAEIETRTRGQVAVRLLDVSEPEPAPALAITLALGISRGERMDLAIQKAVELGVSGIQPLFSTRTLVRLSGERLAKRAQHWQGVVIAACEQSGRRRLPAMATPVTLEAWLGQAPTGGILLHHAADKTLTELPPPQQHISLLIGPEGGLTPEEREQAQARAFTPVRLGPRVLRTETAPLAAIAAMQTLWGDFRAL